VKRRSLILFGIVIAVVLGAQPLLAAAPVYDEKYGDGALLPFSEVGYRGPSTQGLTGLLVTNSAAVLPKGQKAVGIGVSYEQGSNPNFSVLTVPVTFTMGIGSKMEVGAKVKVLSTDNDFTARETGLGDSEIAIKWRLTKGDDFLPAIAVGFGGILPTAGKSKGLNQVDQWGAKVMLMVSQESLVVGEYGVGVYLEGQGVFIDTFAKEDVMNGKDIYAKANAGILFSPTEEKKLQFILEYNRVGFKSIITEYEGSPIIFTPAVRYVMGNTTITGGAEFIERRSSKPDNSNRFSLMVSRNF
jgi:hypothetical protein